MKKLLLLIIVFIFSLTLSACDWFDGQVVDIGIEVTEVEKIMYEYEEVFDPATIKVSVVQSNQNRILLNTSRVTFTGFDSSEPGIQYLTISYQDFTTGLWIIILDPIIEPVLTEIGIIVKAPNKLIYAQNEMLDLTGLRASVIFSDYSTRDLGLHEITTTGFTSSTPGTKTVTVAYKTFTDTFKVAITEVQAPLTKVGIEITAPTKLNYQINETINLAGLAVRLLWSDGSNEVLTSSQYTVTSVLLTQAGVFNVFVSYEEFEVSFQVTVAPNQDFITMAYYNSAKGLVGNALFLELRSIINTGFISISYGEARDILQISDRDPSNSSNLILVYRGTSVKATWDGGITWNREHVWPQSLLGVSVTNTSRNVGSDLQNLKPANPAENTSRSNKYFANTTTAASYAPRDAVKGDVARILFYMVTMYHYLELVNANPSIYQMAWFSTLLDWHDLDPVDQFERNRNEVIFSYQKNRNPYIDYPEFVGLIWG
jgi:endonuclease I